MNNPMQQMQMQQIQNMMNQLSSLYNQVSTPSQGYAGAFPRHVRRAAPCQTP